MCVCKGTAALLCNCCCRCVDFLAFVEFVRPERRKVCHRGKSELKKGGRGAFVCLFLFLLIRERGPESKEALETRNEEVVLISAITDCYLFRQLYAAKFNGNRSGHKIADKFQAHTPGF